VITTHVLDTALGRPAQGIAVALLSRDEVIATATTDVDGRVGSLGPAHLEPGQYRLVFDTAGYHDSTGQPSFFPEVAITFNVDDGATHHHVPLLLSPYAYSTYRGS
jgi:5-hydroxyisourate hydrolase